jgi:hypothetical protein
MIHNPEDKSENILKIIYKYKNDKDVLNLYNIFIENPLFLLCEISKINYFNLFIKKIIKIIFEKKIILYLLMNYS